jgi:hypothetical protein
LPVYDHSIASAVTDLHERAADEWLVVWGEFGRTPSLNINDGRYFTRAGFARLRRRIPQAK